MHTRGPANMMCKIFFICFLAIVCSTDALAQCKKGVRCTYIEQCSGLVNDIRKFTRNEAEFNVTLKRLECAVDRNSKSMVCCEEKYYTGAPDVRYRGFNNETMALLPNLNVCGIIHSSDKIYGGEQTDIDEHPWMALLGYQEPKGLRYRCGGILISSRYVLTAAHCVKRKEGYILSHVRLGEWNTSSEIDCDRGECSPPPLEVTVEESIPHEDYRPTDKDQHNDIALLRLSQDVPFNGSESDVKLKVSLPVVKNADCAKIFHTLTDKQMCAGGRTKQDTCNGDSGGPLMALIPKPANWMAVGVVSYGRTDCGIQGFPGVYTRVTAYIDWILSKLRA